MAGDAFAKLLFLLMIIFCVSVFGGCSTSPDEVLHTARAVGMTQVTSGGRDLFACGRGDKTFGRRFTALNPAGKTTSGVVCCGIFKGCTVRF